MRQIAKEDVDARHRSKERHVRVLAQQELREWQGYTHGIANPKLQIGFTKQRAGREISIKWENLLIRLQRPFSKNPILQATPSFTLTSAPDEVTQALFIPPAFPGR